MKSNLISKNTCTQKFIGIILILIISGLCNSSFAQPSIIFGKQFGTDKDDAGQEIVTYKSGDFVLSGTTLGDLCSANLGKSDGFIIKYDSTGKKIWGKQFGTKDKDRVLKLKRDIRGNLYAAGNTYGKINGKHFGNRDMFVYKFDRNGNLLKSVILGTDSVDYLSDIYIDKNMNIYIAGNTKGKIGKKSYGNWDFFIMKLDSNFNKIYTYQFGTNKQDYCKDLKIDKNNDIYIVGGTDGKIGDTVAGKTDAFVAKYSQNRKLLMTKQFGTDKIDAAENLLIDNKKNMYISGIWNGSREDGWNCDVFLMKMDKNANIIWEKQFGTNSWDLVWDMAFVHSQKGIIISGNSSGRAIDEKGYSKPGAYVKLFDNQGNLKWSRVFRPKGINRPWIGGRHITIYKDKYIYFTGSTWGDLFSKNPNKKVGDVFIVKLGL